MKIVLEKDCYRDDGYNYKYIALTNETLSRLLNKGIITEDLVIIGKLKHVKAAFFDNHLDLYIDDVHYCGDCKQECKDCIHCHKCKKCLPIDSFSKTIDYSVINICDDCKSAIYKNYAPGAGYGMVGGYMGANPYIFKLP